MFTHLRLNRVNSLELPGELLSQLTDLLFILLDNVALLMRGLLGSHLIDLHIAETSLKQLEPVF